MNLEILDAPCGYTIVLDTVVEGCVSLWRDDTGKAFVFKTREEAEREIVDDLMLRLEEYVAGERDFDEAVTVEEYVVPVFRLPDGRFRYEDGQIVE